MFRASSAHLQEDIVIYKQHMVPSLSVRVLVACQYAASLGYFSGIFLFVVIILTIMLYCTFRRIGLLSFYIFFESRLIPTLFLILGWGYQPERVQAGIYLLFYTLLASLPLLVQRPQA